MPRVDAFVYDDENEQKFAEHGLTAEVVDQVLDSPYRERKNRHGRRSPVLLIGRDHGGKCIAIPIERTQTPFVWRPVTAWPCKDVEAVYLEAEGI